MKFEPPHIPEDTPNPYTQVKRWGLVSGPVLALLLFFFEPIGSLDSSAHAVAGLAIWMAIWWLMEVMPLPVTALIPLVWLPLTEATTIAEAAAPYARPIIFLFLGGFLIATAMQKQNLHARVALNILKHFGNRPSYMIAGFMISSCFLSMWISNTATTLMMLPLAMVAIQLARETAPQAEAEVISHTVGTALLLGIAYSATIGGIATIIGTPPNAVFVGFMESNYDVEISFRDWMMVALPISLIMLVISWGVLTKLIHNVDNHASIPVSFVREELKKLGKMKRGERTVGIIILCTAFSWLMSKEIQTIIPGINDVVIAMMGGLAMFIVPIRMKKNEFPLTWDDTTRLPWGILILFGGGLSLGAAFQSSGLDLWIANQLTSGTGISSMVLLVLVASTVLLQTEIMSNLATINIFLPIVTAAAISMGEDPLTYAIPVTLAASCAFMMPVATAPNAIVFSTGHIHMKEMVRAGVILNLVGIVIILILSSFLVPAVFDLASP